MRRQIGRIRRKLATTLQREFPIIGKPVTWKPEKLYPARGAIPKGMDRYSWSGVPVFTDTGNAAGLYDSYNTMTACANAKKLVRTGNEIGIDI